MIADEENAHTRAQEMVVVGRLELLYQFAADKVWPQNIYMPLSGDRMLALVRAGSRAVH